LQGPVGACDSFQRDKGSTMTEKMDWLGWIGTVSGFLSVFVVILVAVMYILKAIQEFQMNDEERAVMAERLDAENLSKNVRSMCIDGKKFAMTRIGPNSWNAVQIFDTDRKGNMNVVRCREE